MATFHTATDAVARAERVRRGAAAADGEGHGADRGVAAGPARAGRAPRRRRGGDPQRGRRRRASPAARSLPGYPRPATVGFLGRFDEPRKGMPVLLDALRGARAGAAGPAGARGRARGRGRAAAGGRARWPTGSTCSAPSTTPTKAAALRSVDVFCAPNLRRRELRHGADRGDGGRRAGAGQRPRRVPGRAGTGPACCSRPATRMRWRPRWSALLDDPARRAALAAPAGRGSPTSAGRPSPGRGAAGLPAAVAADPRRVAVPGRGPAVDGPARDGADAGLLAVLGAVVLVGCPGARRRAGPPAGPAARAHRRRPGRARVGAGAAGRAALAVAGAREAAGTPEAAGSGRPRRGPAAGRGCGGPDRRRGPGGRRERPRPGTRRPSTARCCRRPCATSSPRPSSCSMLARHVHNDAVRDTLGLRSRRLVRWLHLAGTAPLPRVLRDRRSPSRAAAGAAPTAARRPAAAPPR